jgi:hypothetical protein
MSELPNNQKQEIMEKKPYTFADLKRDVNQLTEGQLSKPVYVSREEESLEISELAITEYDCWVHKDDYEDSGTLEELKDIHGEDFDEANYFLATPKGSPFLAEDF